MDPECSFKHNPAFKSRKTVTNTNALIIHHIVSCAILFLYLFLSQTHQLNAFIKCLNLQEISKREEVLDNTLCCRIYTSSSLKLISERLKSPAGIVPPARVNLQFPMGMFCRSVDVSDVSYNAVSVRRFGTNMNMLYCH